MTMPICSVKWRDSWVDGGKTHEGVVVGWVTKGGNLDGRVWAVVLKDGKFIDVVAAKLTFVRWGESDHIAIAEAEPA